MIDYKKLLKMIPQKRISLGEGIMVDAPATSRLDTITKLLQKFGAGYEQKILKVIRDDIREEIIKLKSPKIKRFVDDSPLMFDVPRVEKKKSVIREH